MTAPKYGEAVYLDVETVRANAGNSFDANVKYEWSTPIAPFFAGQGRATRIEISQANGDTMVYTLSADMYGEEEV